MLSLPKIIALAPGKNQIKISITWICYLWRHSHAFYIEKKQKKKQEKLKVRRLQYVFQAACPKTHTTESQERKMLLCLDIINNLYLKHAPVFSHFERTLDTGGLTIDVFFNTAISTTGFQTFFFFFCCLFSLNAWAFSRQDDSCCSSAACRKQRVVDMSGFWFVTWAAFFFSFLFLSASDSANASVVWTQDRAANNS